MTERRNACGVIEPEIIEGLGQFRAGSGAIVTAWHNSRADALEEFRRLQIAAACFTAPDVAACAVGDQRFERRESGK